MSILTEGQTVLQLLLPGGIKKTLCFHAYQPNNFWHGRSLYELRTLKPVVVMKSAFSIENSVAYCITEDCMKVQYVGKLVTNSRVITFKVST